MSDTHSFRKKIGDRRAVNLTKKNASFHIAFESNIY